VKAWWAMRGGTFCADSHGGRWENMNTDLREQARERRAAVARAEETDWGNA